MSQVARRLVPFALVYTLAGCGEDATPNEILPPPPGFAPSQKVRDGTPTTHRPEVGWFGGCTATLVAPDVAITAAT